MTTRWVERSHGSPDKSGWYNTMYVSTVGAYRLRLIGQHYFDAKTASWYINEQCPVMPVPVVLLWQQHNFTLDTNMTTNDPTKQPKRHHIQWNDFDDAVQDVTDAIVKQRTRNQFTNDMLIGVQMGGLPLMTAVVNRLKDKYHYKIDNLQIATTSAYRPCIKALAQQFNDHIDTGNIRSHIWLFEDIVDTGYTIENLISRLIIKGGANISSKMITTCCVVSRVKTNYDKLNIIAGQRLTFDPETFITFPWETQQ